MEDKSKKMLVSLLLLIAAALVVIEAYTQDIVVGYPIGLSLGLLGSILWLLADT